MIGLRHRATWHGPNPLAREPVVVVEFLFDGSRLAWAPAAVARLVALSPAGFSLASAVTNHVEAPLELAGWLTQWTLSALNHVRGAVRAAGVRPGKSAERVEAWLGFHEPRLSLAALSLAVRAIEAAARGEMDPERLDALLGPVDAHPELTQRARSILTHP